MSEENGPNLTHFNFSDVNLNTQSTISPNANSSPPQSPHSPTSNKSFARRLSSILPAYIRRKSARKDSIFASESTTVLWPFYSEDKVPTISEYKDLNTSSETSQFKFGWINGVYIRTVLNIWGVMLFLRMGWMTGQAGIALSLLIVVVSTLVTLFSAISMSAICTNGEVGTGGIYYMISRSLGAEAGSMIGIVFSFANAVLVSANLVGAAETAVDIMALFDFSITGNAINDTRLIGALLLVFVAIIPLIGMDWEAKAMMLLLLLLLISLVNYLVGTFLPPSSQQESEGFVGWSVSVAKENLKGQWDQVAFFDVFGVFFPSVIGIFAGASMSGDLRDPNAAIPKGTFLAIITTSSVYIILIICLGFTVYPYASGVLGDNSHEKCNNSCNFGLIPNYQTMTMSSGFGPLIYVGIFAATISSALGSYVCAPRIFQALCEDNLFPYIKYFAKGYGKINDPRRGYVLTFAIALAFISIGELNIIAPIISNFFMASFFLVNMACFHSSFVGSPSFRPTFRYYNQWISLLTSIVCIVIMFLLEYISALITVLVMSAIYLYMTKRGPEVNWGTSKKAQMYNSALFSALKLNHFGDHVKNFRPSILLLTGNPSARIPLVEFANNITKNKSLLLMGHIVNNEIDYKIREKVISSQYEWMSRRRIKGFYLLLESNSLKSGAKSMIQISGLGRKLRANILMMGYKSSWKDCLTQDVIDYYNVLLIANQMQLAIMILRIQEGLDYADFFELDNDKLNTFNMNILPTIVEPIESIDIESGKQMNSLNNFDKNLKKDRIDLIKGLIPNDAIEAMNQFNERQMKGTIDIWWLTDDGGLTIMIPYLLSLNDIWRECSLRIFSMAKTNEEIHETKQNLSQLISKLRIPCSEIQVFAESDLEINFQSKLRFESLIEKFIAKTESNPSESISVTKEEVSKYKDISNKYLKIRELLVQNTSKTTLLVMTLPVVSEYIPIPLYMSWLEVITEDMPPFLLIRGNKRVISI